MIFIRTLSLLLLLSSALCFVLYAFKGSQQWRKRGLTLLIAFVVSALIFFAVLIAEKFLY